VVAELARGQTALNDDPIPTPIPTATGARRWLPQESSMLARALAVSVVLFSVPVAAQTLQPGWIADPKTGCRVSNPESVPDEAVTWSGGCAKGLAQGRGVLQWYRAGKPTGGRYEGEYRDGVMNGRGVATFESGNRYDGEWQDGRRTGRGVFTWPNGNRFEGQWEDGKRTGWGVHTFDGKRYEGEYSNDMPHGAGTYTAADGRVYAGTWKNGCLRQGSLWAVVSVTPKSCGFE
jgi:hypothetical protein